jgi:hypothetical protein
MQQSLPRNQFVGIKLSAVELCDLRRAARKSESVSAFVRAAIQRAIAEQPTGAAR